MRKLIINASITVDEDFNPNILQRMLAAMKRPDVDKAEGQGFASVMAVDIKDVSHLPERVWVCVPPDDEEPMYLVRDPNDEEYEGVALSDQEMDDLVTNGVCVFSRARYPRSDRYGLPRWASHDNAELAPAIVGFAVSKYFGCLYEDSGDDTCESFRHQIALPKGHPLTKKLEFSGDE